MTLNASAMMLLIDQFTPHRGGDSWLKESHDYVENPGTVDGVKLEIVAIQYGARIRSWKRVKNYVYKICDGSNTLVYKKRGSPMWVIRMGISYRHNRIFRRPRYRHKNAVTAEAYARNFLNKTPESAQWRKENRFILVSNTSSQ